MDPAHAGAIHSDALPQPFPDRHPALAGVSRTVRCDRTLRGAYPRACGGDALNTWTSIVYGGRLARETAPVDNAPGEYV